MLIWYTIITYNIYILLYTIITMQQTTIMVEKQTQQKLKEIGNMNDTYDSVINKLIVEHESLKKMELLVETQHEIAKKGSFVEFK